VSALPVVEPELRHFLHPGGVVAFDRPAVVTTILGSCVSLCLYDTVTGVGGMNHFLLPGGGEGPRYAEPACEELRRLVLARGASPWHLRAKLFGGAWMHAGGTALGPRNGEVARAILQDWRLPLTAFDVGGPHGRKLVFETATGHAFVRALGASA
jgi:chemotaxis protein CheD